MLERTRTYLKVSPLQNTLTFTGIATEFFTGNIQVGGSREAFSLSMLGLYNLAFIAINQILAMHHYKDYKKIKTAFEKYGWNRHIVNRSAGTWCGRQYTKQAAISAGHRKEMRDYMKENDFKWYHLLPRRL